MNFDDLWIGDLVWVRSKSKNGKWEGRAGSDQARIRMDHKTILLPLSDLSEAKEGTAEHSDKVTNPEVRAPKAHFESKEIDLHINKLNPFDHPAIFNIQTGDNSLRQSHNVYP